MFGLKMRLELTGVIRYTGTVYDVKFVSSKEGTGVGGLQKCEPRAQYLL